MEEITAELSLRLERLNINKSETDEDNILEEHALFSKQFKGKCRNCGQISHKAFNARRSKTKMAETTETRLDQIIAFNIVRRGRACTEFFS